MAIDKSRCNNPLFGTERSRIIEDSSVLGLGEDLTVTIADYLDEVAQESEQLVLDVATLAKNAMVRCSLISYNITRVHNWINAGR